MAQIISIPELYTDGIADLGGAYEIKMHLRVRFDNGSEEWLYFGTVPEPALTATARPAVRFPTDIINLGNANDLLYDLAIQAVLRKEER